MTFEKDSEEELTQESLSNESLVKVSPPTDNHPIAIEGLIPPLIIDDVDKAIETNVKRSDLINCANSFKLLHSAVESGAIRGVKSLCTVLEAIRRESIHRRNILEIPYGAKNTDNRRDPFEPLP